MKIYYTTETAINPPIQKTEYITGTNLLGNLDKISEISRRNFSGFLILTDDIVGKIYLKIIVASLARLTEKVSIVRIKHGEGSKNFQTTEKIIKIFFEKGFDKNSCLVSLGGGVVTDVGNFTGSILLRGISIIHLPTTLLAQIDASIGGKGAVDVWMGNAGMFKNMVGTITQPDFVITDIDVLDSLPEKKYKSGLGEMAKYWVGWGIPDKTQLTKLKEKNISKKELAEIISLCQKIKMEIVGKDPLDNKGIRNSLNLGHTFGHAVEGVANGKLSHGQAVAVGLVAAARLSVLAGYLKEEVYKDIKYKIESLGLPVSAKGLNKEKILPALKMDKKGGTFVLIHDIGKLETKVHVDNQQIEQVINEIIL